MSLVLVTAALLAGSAALVVWRRGPWQLAIVYLAGGASLFVSALVVARAGAVSLNDDSLKTEMSVISGMAEVFWGSAN